MKKKKKMINKKIFFNAFLVIFIVWIGKLISYSKHMKQSIDKTLDLVLEDDSKGNLFEGKNSVIGEMRGSWSQHYNSWKYSNLKEKIIIKYNSILSFLF